MATDKPEDEYVRPEPPKRGDKLFVQDRANWPMDALLNPHHGSDYPYRQYAYREGYKMAGKILTEWAAQNGWVDFLVYPVCYSYRHYVELNLKHQIEYGCRLVRREMTPKELESITDHKLLQLWECCKRIEKEVAAVTGESYPPKELEGITAYIQQLHEVDRVGEGFRYALAVNGSVSLGQMERINLAQFAEAMERLCTSLETIDNYYVHMLSELDDMYSGQSPG